MLSKKTSKITKSSNKKSKQISNEGRSLGRSRSPSPFKHSDGPNLNEKSNEGLMNPLDDRAET